jgi:hypothetical protein
VNWPFAMGVIRPTRIWCFAVPQNTLGATDNCFPASVGVNCFTNTQILLNGNNFYNQQFVSQYDHYREFKSQLIGASSSMACGTPISYSDYITGTNLTCFDLSRNPTVKTNNLCTLTLITTVFDQTVAPGSQTAPAADYEMWVFLERLQTCTLKVSEGGVEILSRQGADL